MSKTSIELKLKFLAISFNDVVVQCMLLWECQFLIFDGQIETYLSFFLKKIEVHKVLQLITLMGKIKIQYLI